MVTFVLLSMYSSDFFGSIEIEVQPIVWTVRFYPEGGGYPGPFSGVCTVQAIGSTAISVSALHGTVTKQQLQDSAQYFFNKGFKFAMAERHGKIIRRKIENYLPNKKSPDKQG